jgi:hypothetical protein
MILFIMTLSEQGLFPNSMRILDQGNEMSEKIENSKRPVLLKLMQLSGMNLLNIAVAGIALSIDLLGLPKKILKNTYRIDPKIPHLGK